MREHLMPEEICLKFSAILIVLRKTDCLGKTEFLLSAASVLRQELLDFLIF